jgi:hypothetical protein
LAIQEAFARSTIVADDRAFQTRFNGFYKVRRGAAWQQFFYNLMDRCRRDRLMFSSVLVELREKTGRCEASFASKLFATVNQDWPVIDSVVLANVGEKLPRPALPDRMERIIELHQDMRDWFCWYLTSADGGFLVAEFRRVHACNITEMKMLDLVLWQMR